jgi:hypothetical protein
MKQTLLKLKVFVASLFLISAVTAQQANISGYTFTGGYKVVRTVAEIVAADAAYKKPPFAMRYKREHEARLRLAANPQAIMASQSGTMLKNGLDNLSATSTTGTQTIYSNFLGVRIGDTPGWNPPDNNGEVGTTQIAFTVNGRIRFYNKPTVTGTAVTTPTGTSNTEPGSPVFDVDSDVFLTDATLGIDVGSDPHVRFDRLTQRWVIVQIDITNTKNNYCQVAISSGPSVTSNSSWTMYYFRVGDTGSPTTWFFDYPTLGIDNKSLYIGGNMFTSQFKGCNMWVVNKADLIAGTLTVTAFNQGTTGTNMYTPQGVHNDDPASTEGYFIGASQTVGSKMILRRVSYTGATPTISADIVFNTIATSAPMAPPSKSPGSTLDALDLRPFAAMIKKNKITGVSTLWTANTSKVTSLGVGSSTGDRDAGVWYEIGNLTTTPTILRSATFYDATGTGSTIVHYIIPSIAMSGQGHCAMSFTTCGPSKYPQMTVVGKYRTDAGATWQAPVDATNTTSSYSGSRWGDYSQTVIDPTDDMTIWTFNQYAQGANNWGTRAVQLKAPPPATPALASTPNRSAAESVTINGTSVNNSEFFDPGNDVGGPGFNRLKVAVTGPSTIAVSNVVFVSPTQITATFNTLNAAAGIYTVTITNPDGQTATTTFTLAPVPVTLTSFTGKGVNHTVQLNWHSTAEINLKNYSVEKSVDGITFQAMTQASPKGGVSTPADYATVDRMPYPNYSYYRLQSINADDSYTYSQVVKVKTDARSISVTRLFPNPTAGDVNLEIVADHQQKLYAAVYNITGSKVANQSIELASGVNQKTISMQHLSAGSYVLELKDADNNIIEKTKIIRN